MTTVERSQTNSFPFLHEAILDQSPKCTLNRIFNVLLAEQDPQGPEDLPIDIGATLENEGWSETSAPPISRLTQRVTLNQLNKGPGILSRAGFETVFRYYYWSRMFSTLHKIYYQGLMREFESGFTVTGWTHDTAPGVVVFVGQLRANTFVQCMGIWIFSPDRRSLGQTEQAVFPDLTEFETAFDAKSEPLSRLARTGLTHSWCQSKRQSPYAHGEWFVHGSYGFTSGRRFDVRDFVSELLPGYELPQHGTLYSAERIYTLRN